jgi:hypothetical protein
MPPAERVQVLTHEANKPEGTLISCAVLDEYPIMMGDVEDTLLTLLPDRPLNGAERIYRTRSEVVAPAGQPPNPGLLGV